MAAALRCRSNKRCPLVRLMAVAVGLRDLWGQLVTGDRSILLSHRALAVIHRETRAAGDGCETGGILLGTTIEKFSAIRHAGGPGPSAVRTATTFLRDRVYSQRFAEACWSADRSLWIGDWHSHPAMAPVPSETDLATYRSLLADSELCFGVFISLITTATASGVVMAAWWCTHDGVRPVAIHAERMGNH
ncbi:Mov34/MPN/PAD-1 family protein [Mycolicibacterium neoaurum]|uniref:Mov34/MPN/PAD-1 family protein n=1 Tax=Mycolicibacterium neoaurum TaxID=1795 RepID=UPI0009DD2170